MSRRPGLLALLLMLSAIATSAALNLAFTLPLLLLDWSLLAFAQVRWLCRWRSLADGTVILGMTAVIAGVAVLRRECSPKREVGRALLAAKPPSRSACGLPTAQHQQERSGY